MSKPKSNKKSVASKWAFVYFFFAAFLLVAAVYGPAIKHSTIQTESFVIDEGPYNASDGTEYGHSFLLSIPSGSSSFKIGEVDAGGSFISKGIFFEVKNTPNLAISTANPTVEVTLRTYSLDAGVLKSTNTKAISSSYTGWDKGATTKLSANTNLAKDADLLVNARGEYRFHWGYAFDGDAYFPPGNTRDSLPSTDLGVYTLPASTWEYSFDSCSRHGGRGANYVNWDGTSLASEVKCGGSYSRPVTYRGSYAAFIAQSYFVGDTSSNSYWKYWLRWDVPYGGLLPPSEQQTIFVAFNAPDSDGDGVDDAHDRYPVDSNLSSIKHLEEKIENLEAKLLEAEERYGTASDEADALREELWEFRGRRAPFFEGVRSTFANLLQAIMFYLRRGWNIE